MRAPAEVAVFTPDELRGAGDLRAQFGVKGAELCEFAWRCAGLGHQVPASWLLPAAAADLALGTDSQPAGGPVPKTPGTVPRPGPGRDRVQRRGQPAEVYLELPGPATTPRCLAPRSRQFAARFEPALAMLPPRPRALLRTSVTWPDPVSRPPGVDVTVTAGGPMLAARLFDGVHKAYADLCRRRSAAGAPRFGVVLTDLVPVVLEGTAYAAPGSLAVELGAGGVEPVLAASPSELASSGLLTGAEAAKLFGQLGELAGEVSAGLLVELEFLLDHDRRLVPAQRRELAVADGGPAPFHSMRSFTGPAADLRGAARDRRLLRRALADGPGGGLVLPVLDDAHADVFALLWMLDSEPSLPRPGALVLTRRAESHAGMRTHLRWLAAAMLPGTSIFYLPDRAVPPGDGRLAIGSDGVRARCKREPG